MNRIPFQEMANAVRALSMDAIHRVGSGHIGLPLGAADVATVLFTRFLKFDPSNPDWPDRDRFVLSAGHGSMLLYSLSYLAGYPEMSLDEIKRFRRFPGKTPGHPEYHPATGVEATTGPLGQGIGMAVGMALSERMLRERFGVDLVNHFTYALVGDGCLMEGISYEAAAFAGHLNLDRLIVLFDDNRISIDGPVALATSENQQARFEACGWYWVTADGHDPESITAAIEEARQVHKPAIVSCRTTIGLGLPGKAGTAEAHGSPPTDQDISGARDALAWPHPPFEVPRPILDSWRKAGMRGHAGYQSWSDRLASSGKEVRETFKAWHDGTLAGGWENKFLISSAARLI
jgi:transketolase